MALGSKRMVHSAKGAQRLAISLSKCKEHGAKSKNQSIGQRAKRKGHSAKGAQRLAHSAQPLAISRQPAAISLSKCKAHGA